MFCGLYGKSESQKPISEDLFYAIQVEFITDWAYFRMRRNPLLAYKETHTEWGEWKRPSQVKGILPDTFFTKNYEPDIKIYRWEYVYKRCPGCEQVRNPFLYIVEKEDGIAGIRREWFTHKIIDTLRLNVYDSIFPYDNRFLVYYTEHEDVRKCIFYSGNVDWVEPFFNDDMTIKDVAMLRGVQFGLEYVRKLEQKMIDSLRKLRPEYPDYVYVTADESFVSRGKILIAGHEKTILDYIEFIFYSDDPIKTGDSRGVYYEMRYLLPSNIKSITERRLVKRKLTEEEHNKMFLSLNYLRTFRDMTYEMKEEELVGKVEDE